MKNNLTVLTAFLLVMMTGIAHQQITGKSVVDSSQETAIFFDTSGDNVQITVIPGYEGSGNELTIQREDKKNRIALKCRDRCTRITQTTIGKERQNIEGLSAAIFDYTSFNDKEFKLYV